MAGRGLDTASFEFGEFLAECFVLGREVAAFGNAPADDTAKAERKISGAARNPGA